ncbi:MAG: hypothetical protein R3F49_02215 [Planctomycetota bacterium]
MRSLSTNLHLPARLTALALAASAPALAQGLELGLDFAVDANTSSLDLSTTFELRLPGTLIGDYDVTANPTGTRTVPGLFGGSGNQPIDIQLDLLGALDIDVPASGAFTLAADPSTSSASIEGLALDLATGGAAGVALSVRLTYPTFRTFSPDSLYLSLVPIELPLGQATIGDIAVAQVGPALGTLTATATPGVFDLDALVAVTLTFDLDFNGQITPVGPVPAALPLSAVLDLAACDAALTGAAMTAANQTIPAPAPVSLMDVPFPLPTILPPGGTANLLFTVDLDEVVFDLSLDLALDADAPASERVERYCVASPNSAGLGATLDLVGSTSLGLDQLDFSITGLPQQSFGFLLMSQPEDFVANVGGGEGTLCLASPIYRFQSSIQNSGPGGSVLFRPDLAALPGGVVFAAGDTWRFQYWYRDANPTTTSNLSDGLRVQFCQ